jgi:hypothetical protein
MRSPSGGCAPSATNASITSSSIGRRHLEQVLRGYVAHFNAERPHRSLELASPAGSPRSRGSPSADILRRDVVGGLIHEYYAAAA